MNKSFVKKYGTLLLLAAGAGMIFQLPYIRETFYVPIQEGMGLTNEQMGSLNSAYSTMGLLSYFVGGLIADKFSARKLLTFSFVATALLGFWYASFPSYNTVRLIYALMGVTTIITYWSACIKATRMLGDSTEQGRLFGWQEGLRGFTNALGVFAMMAAYNHFANAAMPNTVAGTQWAIRVCSIIVLIIGILNWFIIDDTPPEAQATSIADTAKGMWQAMKMPRVWILCGIVFGAYSVYGLLGYINTYAIRVYGADVSTGISLGAWRYMIQAVGGVLGGILADKIGSKVKVIAGGGILLALSFLGYIILPVESQFLTTVVVNFILGLFLIYVVRSQYFAVIDDAGIPVQKSGRVSGLMSFIGYAPDLFMYTMVGRWMDNHAGKEGFNMMFVYAIAMALICVAFSIVLGVIRKRDQQKALAAE